MLHNLTTAINFVSLLIALWLGLVLVRRRSSRLEAWLTAFALWSAGGYFLNELLALNPPHPPPGEMQAWLVHLIVFWPENVFELGWKGWLQGWLAAYSMAFWYHATLVFLPGRFNRRRVILALAGYMVVFAGIQVGTFINLKDSSLVAGDPVYLVSFVGQFSALTWLGLTVFAGLSIANLARAARAAPAERRIPFHLLIYATTGGALVLLLLSLPAFLHLRIPQAPAAVLLAAGLLLGGIGAGRCTSWSEDRPAEAEIRNRTDGVEHGSVPTAPVEEAQAPEKGPAVSQGDEQNGNGEAVPASLVELGLRNLYDYTYLADLPLARLCIVQRRLEQMEPGASTSIDRGKAVSQVLAEAVCKLKPAPVEPDGVLPRSWHPFMILRDAYLDGKPNLGIMSRLYISESTFNRTRRSAIHAVAIVLREMEDKVAAAKTPGGGVKTSLQR